MGANVSTRNGSPEGPSARPKEIGGDGAKHPAERWPRAPSGSVRAGVGGRGTAQVQAKVDTKSKRKVRPSTAEQREPGLKLMGAEDPRKQGVCGLPSPDQAPRSVALLPFAR